MHIEPPGKVLSVNVRKFLGFFCAEICLGKQHKITQKSLPWFLEPPSPHNVLTGLFLTLFFLIPLLSGGFALY